MHLKVRGFLEVLLEAGQSWTPTLLAAGGVAFFENAEALKLSAAKSCCLRTDVPDWCLSGCVLIDLGRSQLAVVTQVNQSGVEVLFESYLNRELASNNKMSQTQTHCSALLIM